MDMTEEMRLNRMSEIDNHLEQMEVTATAIGGNKERHEYADAIVGVADDGDMARIVYTRGGLVKALKRLHGFSDEDAEEWFEFNLVRGIGYMPKDQNPPLIIDDGML